MEVSWLLSHYVTCYEFLGFRNSEHNLSITLCGQSLPGPLPQESPQKSVTGGCVTIWIEPAAGCGVLWGLDPSTSAPMPRPLTPSPVHQPLCCMHAFR